MCFAVVLFRGSLLQTRTSLAHNRAGRGASALPNCNACQPPPPRAYIYIYIYMYTHVGWNPTRGQGARLTWTRPPAARLYSFPCGGLSEAFSASRRSTCSAPFRCSAPCASRPDGYVHIHIYIYIYIYMDIIVRALSLCSAESPRRRVSTHAHTHTHSLSLSLLSLSSLFSLSLSSLSLSSLSLFSLSLLSLSIYLSISLPLSISCAYLYSFKVLSRHVNNAQPH